MEIIKEGRECIYPQVIMRLVDIVFLFWWVFKEPYRK